MLITLGVVTVLAVLIFLIAWHYVLSAEVIAHPQTLTVTSDTEAALGICGNGKIEMHEECDDGNDYDYDGCSRCLVDAHHACAEEPSICIRLSEGTTGCGNGKIENGELCDDGNGMDGDGCSYRCEMEAGYLCDGPGACSRRAPCGNGRIEKGETCDDGNKEDYDGCNAACGVDHYFECMGTPSMCTRIVIQSSSSAEAVLVPVVESSSSMINVEKPQSSESTSSVHSQSPRRRQGANHL